MITVNRSAFKSVIVQNEIGEDLRIEEGMRVVFNTETGEIVKGDLVKISGKDDKTKLQIIPYNSQKQEIWELVVIGEGSLKIDEDETDN
jgi:hypothetical protein